MKAIVLLGAPGAGKGTVAAGLLKAGEEYAHVSTGDMLREAVRERRPVGVQAKGYMEKGELVPDEIILELVRERLARDGGRGGYLFDGFPRTLEQARQLDAVLAEFGGRINAVFLLSVPEDVIVDRISGRRICQKCGAVYHVRNMPPRVEGVCDRCGGAVVQRPDDNETTVRNRLAVYRRQTESVIAFYRERGVLFEIPAAGSPEETVAVIRRRLAAIRGI
jgi:adenylate kinase